MTDIRVQAIDSADLPALLRAITDIRMQVFSAWPYLYDGNLDDEDEYLRHFTRDPQTIVLGAWDGDRLVGVSTASRWETHPENLLDQLPGLHVPVTDILYLAESVLYADYRGQGIGNRFFQGREAFARQIGRSHVAFAAVIRDADDPLRPKDYRDLGPWWRRLGYAPLNGAQCQMWWKDHGRDEPSLHHLQVWLKEL